MSKNKGFSLVELIIVIAIMAVLIGLLSPQFLKFVKNSKVVADVSNAASIADCINATIMDNGTVDATIQGTGGTALTGIQGLSKLPNSKVDKDYEWVITSNSTEGVTEITLGGDKIYPGGDTNNEYYAAHYSD